MNKNINKIIMVLSVFSMITINCHNVIFAEDDVVPRLDYRESIDNSKISVVFNNGAKNVGAKEVKQDQWYTVKPSIQQKYSWKDETHFLEEDESFEIVDISGPNIKKTLVKDAYDETRNVLGTDLTENGLMTRSISSSTMIQFDHYYK